MAEQDPVIALARCIEHLESGRVAIWGGVHHGCHLTPERSTSLVYRGLKRAFGTNDPAKMAKVLQILQYHSVTPQGLKAFRLPAGSRSQVDEVNQLLTGTVVIQALQELVSEEELIA